jgi:hypothetical protein
VASHSELNCAATRSAAITVASAALPENLDGALTAGLIDEQQA